MIQLFDGDLQDERRNISNIPRVSENLVVQILAKMVRVESKIGEGDGHEFGLLNFHPS